MRCPSPRQTAHGHEARLPSRNSVGLRVEALQCTKLPHFLQRTVRCNFITPRWTAPHVPNSTGQHGISTPEMAVQRLSQILNTNEHCILNGLKVCGLFFVDMRLLTEDSCESWSRQSTSETSVKFYQTKLRNIRKDKSPSRKGLHAKQVTLCQSQQTVRQHNFNTTQIRLWLNRPQFHSLPCRNVVRSLCQTLL
jgi:hypothetical protein